jgi:hypothetical protein
MRELQPPRCHSLPLLIVALTLIALPAAAARYHVDTSGLREAGPSLPGNWTAENCYPDLAMAMAVAATGDSILVAHEDHVVSSSLTVTVAFLGNRSLSRQPDGARLMLGDEGALVLVTAVAGLRLQGLVLSGGSDDRQPPALTTTGPGISLELLGCTFTGLAAVAAVGGDIGGAAVRLLAGGTLTAVDCRFTDNASTGRGGAVYLNSQVEADFTNCLFEANSIRGGDPRGGAIMIDARLALSRATFRECWFLDNWSGGPGGALSTLSAEVLLEDCVVQGNRSGQVNGWSEGAGVHFRRNSTDHTHPTPVTVRRSVFEDNRGAPDLDVAGGDGGGFYTSGAIGGRRITVLVEDCLFTGNYNLLGAGVYVSRHSEGVVQRCRFVDNIAYFQGGGVFKGGASYDNRGETLMIDNCLFLRNRAGFTEGGQATGDFCLGGAVFCRMFPRVVVRHGTFIDNRISASSYSFGDAFAHLFEYGEWEPEMLCTLQNSVFWGSSGAHYQAYSSSGGMVAVQHCAAASDQMSMGGVALVGQVVLSSSPFLSQETGYPLVAGPLIDAGLDLGIALDLERQPRALGLAPDIGCFETPGLEPVETRGLQASPNPFLTTTMLSHDLAEAGQVRLDLHDMRGRLVATLWNGPLAAGVHVWSWDGRDQQGRDCAAAVYIARLQIEGSRPLTEKITWIR